MLINVKKKKNGYNLPNIFQDFTLVSLNRLVNVSFLAFIPKSRKINGALGRIRTPDPLIRSQVLYPTELPARGGQEDVPLETFLCKYYSSNKPNSKTKKNLIRDPY